MAEDFGTVNGKTRPLCACLNLRMAARAMTQRYDRALQPCGLHITQYSLLLALSSTGPITINHLAQRLVMDRTTLSRNLRPLAEKGLTCSQPGEDRRTRVIDLTEEGRRALLEARPLWEEAQESVIAFLGAERFERMLSDLVTSTRILQSI